MRLAALLEECVELPIPIGKETLTVQYRPHAYTGAFVRELPTMTLDNALLAVVSGWDLEKEKGKPIPITAEALENEVPIVLKRRILQAVEGAVFPNLQSSADSSATDS